MATHKYQAKAYLDGKWWMVEIPELGGLTQARKLKEVADMARDFIAVTLEVPVEEVEISLTIERVHELDIAARIAKIQAEKQQAAALEKAALEDSRTLAQELANEELTVREIGLVLGISHQRAHQLLSA
ncbi:MAG: hypothetical protein ACKOQ8_04220 [Micrococcales bacterium]